MVEDYLTIAKSRLHNYVIDGGALDGKGNMERAIEICKVEALIAIADELQKLNKNGVGIKP